MALLKIKRKGKEKNSNTKLLIRIIKQVQHILILNSILFLLYYMNITVKLIY